MWLKRSSPPITTWAYFILSLPKPLLAPAPFAPTRKYKIKWTAADFCEIIQS
ncbi:MAG: hypothetical protein ACT4NX_05885 [Deltaproteobacteria bacterium]